MKTLFLLLALATASGCALHHHNDDAWRSAIRACGSVIDRSARCEPW